jgi:hypothetical protein
MVAIATLVNVNALKDLELLLYTLELWNIEKPTVYIYTDHDTATKIRNILYTGKVVIKEELNAYAGLNRSQMEQLPGVTFTTRFADFCAMKPRLLEWAITEEKAGVLFCDADICHLGPLPIIPADSQLVVSPHMIRRFDTDRFGVYNAGYLYIGSVEVAKKWLELCATSRFFEQGCLEDLYAQYRASAHTFPASVNYGWWRLFQGDEKPDTLKKQWHIKRQEGTVGLIVNGLPVQSIHTHFGEKSDFLTVEFNRWILETLKKLESVRKTKQLLGFIRKTFSLQ